MHVLLWTPWAFFQIHVLFWPFQSVLEEKTLLIQTLWWSAKRLENCLELLMQTHHPAKKSNKNAANNFFVHVWSSWPEALHDVSNANFTKMNNFLYALIGWECGDKSLRVYWGILSPWPNFLAAQIRNFMRLVAETKILSRRQRFSHKFSSTKRFVTKRCCSDISPSMVRPLRQKGFKRRMINL